MYQLGGLAHVRAAGGAPQVIAAKNAAPTIVGAAWFIWRYRDLLLRFVLKELKVLLARRGAAVAVESRVPVGVQDLFDRNCEQLVNHAGHVHK